jgi:LuxR family transcriptional regulator, maltose regulon positive regulatory protein
VSGVTLRTQPSGGAPPARAVPPPPRGAVVRRTRLLRVLDESVGTSVVCLQAPGGYGKTTLLRQWVATDPRPVVWLSVRPQAPDSAWVVQALVAQLRVAGLVSQDAVVPVASDPVSWHLGTLPVVESLISAGPPVLVVIDDAGSMSGETWECLVRSMAESLPAGGQLILATRDDPPPSLTVLGSRGDLSVVGPRQLALDGTEIRQLARLLGAAVTDGLTAQLLEQTEGWPVAVHLALRALASGRDGAPAVTSGASSSELHHYLRTEILDRLPDDDAWFLLRLSVLTQIDAAACSMVAPGTGGLAQLRRLAESSNLLTPLEPSRATFRMHPLLAAFLSSELQATDSTAWQQAHAAASVARQQAGDLDGAVYHARLAGDDDRLGSLVWTRTGFLIGPGQMPVLDRWLSDVDDARLAAQGELALTESWRAAQRGDQARMNRFVLAAQAGVRGGRGDLAADVQLLRATVATDSVGELGSMANAVIDAKQPDDPWLSLAYFLLGVAAMLRARFDDADSALRRGYRLSVAHGVPAMQSRCLAGLAECALADGDEPRAMALIRELRELIGRFRLDQLMTTAPVFVTSATGYVLEGRMVDARREALLALRLTALMRVVPSWNVTYGRLTLAKVFVSLRDYAQAAALLDEAVAAYGPEIQSTRGDQLFAELRQSLAEASTAQARVEALTSAELRVLQYLPTHLSFPQIADELFVSRHTVKTQALSAYRKLGAHTRDEAIQRARDAGLLPRASVRSSPASAR